jgi:adenylosuccinate synthase
MPSLAVVGAQWGDEGKGKIVDYFAEEAHMVVRFQGGNNAGHTVKVGTEVFKLHHLPSGILRRGRLSVIGNGVVIDPGVLMEELDGLEARGMSVKNLRISDRAHVIMPYHRMLDGAEERLRKGAKVGTTGRGIGPAYSDKAARLGVRMHELVDPDALRDKLSFLVPLKQRILDAYGDGTRLDLESILKEYSGYGRRLKGFVTDTGAVVSSALMKGKRVLFEGAQGTLLDIDHGTYPFVTSSICVASNAAAGSGVAPNMIDEVYGVTKAYTTRVGEGPFPTELKGETGGALAQRGGEFGTTTGRARRCGWLDLVLVKHSCVLSGFTGLALTKIDVLGSLDELKVCTHYKLDGRRVDRVPADLRMLGMCEPRYAELPGWSDIEPSAMERILSEGYGALPAEMKGYIKFVEKQMGVPVVVLGLGPGREETVDRRKRKWRPRRG